MEKRKRAETRRENAASNITYKNTAMIEIKGLTKDYGKGKGIFDVNLAVEPGEIYGFLGPNGAGKTTTIRHLLGFIRQDEGSATIDGLDCFHQATEIHKNLGYLAGELAFFDDYSGKQMIDFMTEIKGVRNRRRVEELLERFALDPSGKMKKMSKGMKQKVGIVCAFMNDPAVILLDEPTSGLDPLMQNAFIDLLLEEKKRGKTIFMSSHIFEEVERTCDRTAIIRDGRIVTVENMESLRAKKQKSFVVTFTEEGEAVQFCHRWHNRDFEAAGGTFEIARAEGRTVTVFAAGNVDTLVKELSAYSVADLDIKSSSLEEIFLRYYGEGEEK